MQFTQRRKKPSAKVIHDDEDDDFEHKSKSNSKSKSKSKLGNNRKAIIDVDSDSDDEAANEDLTLKIIEKAVARASHVAGGDVISDEAVTSDGGKNKKKKSKKVKKKKMKKKEKVVVTSDGVGEAETGVVMSVPTEKAEELVDPSVDGMVVNLSEPDAVENSNSENVVLRRLLRGPRYFDPPDKSWGACFNCGEEGHTAVNCTSARRKKPCFVCGSLEHEVKQCQKGQDCFICKGQGHRAKDCPQKMKRCSTASELCLKCGASSHAMYSCNNDYSPDDLKDIQCYVCKKFGHLCCAKYFDVLASEASCYKCGNGGHFGQECRGSKGGETSAGGTPNSCFKCGEGGHFARECKTSGKDFRGSKGDKYDDDTPSSCFKCGEEGHFARECKASGKAKKRTRDSSTPARKKYPKDMKGNRGHNSAPQDFGKTGRKKWHMEDESPNWQSKPKQRGGWIPDDPGDHYPRHGWRSPATPNKNHRIFDLTAGGHGSSPQYFWNNNNFRSGSSNSRDYDSSYDHRYTASRFGHHTDSRRNYNGW